MNVFITKKSYSIQKNQSIGALFIPHEFKHFFLYHNIPQVFKPWNLGLSTTLEKFNIGSNCSSFRLIKFFPRIGNSTSTEHTVFILQ